MMARPLRELIQQLADTRRQLASYGIRDTSGYAELLVAKAFTGTRESDIKKGYDVASPEYGRVEVKSRVLPEDGRKEERVELGLGKTDGFDHLAIVILTPDYRVSKGLVAPYSQVWEIVKRHRYRRISFEQASLLTAARDITAELRSVEDSL